LAGRALTFPILYEDNHVLAVDKPAGMLSQGDLSGDLDVLTVAKELLKRRGAKPGNVYLGLVHRLDRPVSGAMLLAKTSKAAGRLSRQFRERETVKLYRAVIAGVPTAEEAELVHALEKDTASRVTRVVTQGGKTARLSYRVLEQREGVSLLEVTLLTGLPHQIRAQLAAIGHPILGDRKYGAPEHLPSGPGAIALYSRTISFKHPVRDESVTIEAAPPPHWPW
jgi:23S rRNA pseudouridine1911/1915/1917 synthase